MTTMNSSALEILKGGSRAIKMQSKFNSIKKSDETAARELYALFVMLAKKLPVAGQEVQLSKLQGLQGGRTSSQVLKSLQKYSSMWSPMCTKFQLEACSWSDIQRGTECFAPFDLEDRKKLMPVNPVVIYSYGLAMSETYQVNLQLMTIRTEAAIELYKKVKLPQEHVLFLKSRAYDIHKQEEISEYLIKKFPVAARPVNVDLAQIDMSKTEDCIASGGPVLYLQVLQSKDFRQRAPCNLSYLKDVIQNVISAVNPAYPQLGRINLKDTKADWAVEYFNCFRVLKIVSKNLKIHMNGGRRQTQAQGPQRAISDFNV
jgi:hypothetical protein